MAQFITHLKKHRKAIYILIALYTIIATCFILTSTDEYHNSNTINYQKQVLDENWEVSIDGEKQKTPASLPFNNYDSTNKTIDLTTTLPDLGYRHYVLETSLVQKELKVYVDEVLVYETNFNANSSLQTSPGSGKFYVPLPQDCVGKTLRLHYINTVPSDLSSLRTITLSNGNYNPYLIMEHGNIIFFSSTSIILLGLVLFIVAIIYFKEELLFQSLIFIAGFAISSSVWILCNTKLMQFFTENLVLIHNLEYITFFIMPVTLWGFIGRSGKIFSKLSNYMFTFSLIFYLYTMTMKLLGINDFFAYLKLFHLLYILHLIAIVYVLYKNRHHRFDSFKLLCFGLVALASFSFYDLLQYYFRENTFPIPNAFILGIDLMIIFFVLSFIYSMKEQLEENIQNKMYRSLAYSDALTHLSNRMRFEDDIQECEKNIHQNEKLALVVIDINNLKYVNDTYGHLSGDQLIQIVAAEIRISFQIENNAYRIGGDEFAVIVKNESETYLNSRLEYFKKRLATHQEKFSVDAAYGYRFYEPTIHHNLQEVFKEADNRMYENKQAYK